MPAFEPLATFQMLTELLQSHACEDATRYDSRTPTTSAQLQLSEAALYYLSKGAAAMIHFWLEILKDRNAQLYQRVLMNK